MLLLDRVVALRVLGGRLLGLNRESLVCALASEGQPSDTEVNGLSTETYGHEKTLENVNSPGLLDS